LTGSAFIGRATINLASGIHREAYDCDNHNEAAECAAKLEVGLLFKNIGLRSKIRLCSWRFAESALEP
jgi:hypothetical protein